MRASLIVMVLVLAACSTPPVAPPCPPLPHLAADAEPVAHMRVMAHMYQQCARGRA
jgi:hypothetical protein